MTYLSIDVGTTGCKCQLFSENGDIIKYLFREYAFKIIDGDSYVDVSAIEGHLREMIEEISRVFEISSICISSLGESFVLLDENDKILFHPMLYTDTRGEEEAEEIKSAIGEERAFLITGVVPHSMYSLSKLLWIKRHAPDVFSKAHKVMLIGDYIGYLLTGKRVIDYALASRTGAFDIRAMQFSDEVLGRFGINKSLFSTPMRAGSIVGKLKPEWNVPALLVLGSHDQVCAAVGAGVLKAGEAVDGMGTVECTTVAFSKRPTQIEMGRQGYCCVPYAVDGLYCTYILNYSCGSTVNWFRRKITHEYAGDEASFFAYMEKNIPDLPSDVLALPYLAGAATPYQDLSAKGAFLNLSLNTRDCDMYRALIEGMSMEMRMNIETVNAYGIDISEIVATGGCSNSERWMQIKADVQKVPVKVLRSSEGGLCGCAMLQSVAIGGIATLEDARKIFTRYTKHFSPAPSGAYERKYEKYKKIYKLVKELA